MKRFIENIKRYFKYAVYSARADLKAEVAGSYLNWLWWILDPMFFMMIYIFIASVVFKTTEPYFPVFIFTGLTVWDYFNRNINASVKIVSANRAIVTKIYIPKYILVLQKSFVTFFKMLISWGLVAILMFLWKVPLTINILYFIPILLVLYMITFGLSLILTHFGIFIEDLGNVVALGLRLVFYLSGIFYNIATRIPEPFNKILLNCNPVAFIINSFRDTLLYGKAPSFLILGGWFILGIVLIGIGIHIIHKYENSYAKVI
jgi:ABC-type polysaccharide/polyol phosphate export permease